MSLSVAPNDATFLAPPQVALSSKLSSLRQNRYVAMAVKREVWRRDQGQCCFVDPLTNRRCGSRFKLEVHHEIPFAKGGSNTAENLRLLCKLHNTDRALIDYGVEKMEAFIPGLTT